MKHLLQILKDKNNNKHHYLADHTDQYDQDEWQDVIPLGQEYGPTFSSNLLP